MQDNKTNRDKLYTFLTNKGVTGIGANRDEFETIFEDEEKQKKLYDFCVGKGYSGIGKDYDEFAEGFSVQQTAPEQNAFEGLKGMAESQGVTMPVDSTLPTENRNQDIFAGREAMARYADSAQNLRKAQAAYNMSPTAENAEQLDSAAMDFSNVETSRLDAEKEKRTKEELLAERKRLEDAKREAELRLRTRRGEIASPSGMYQMGMAPVTGNQAAEITDLEMTKLYAAVNSYDNAIRSVDRKLNGEEPGFWEGVADATVRNPGFYTMGLTDMSDARGMLNIAQNGVEGREDELLADALYSKNAEQQDEDFGFLYRSGNMFGHSVPFMVQTAVTGGFSGASRAGANLAGRLGKKAAESTIKKKIINAMGTTIDDVIEAGLIANTAGAGGTWANIADRKAGKINIKDGNYVFENGESWLGALYKGEVSSILELYTEKLGGHFEGKLSLTKGLDKIGASRVSNVLLAAKNSDIYKDMSTVMRQFGLNGFPSEVLEEELNIVLNSLLVGDNKLSELWDPDVQLDIIGGMGLTIGTMQVIPGTIATAGYVKNQYQMNRADRRAADVFGEDWEAIKEALDNATNEKVAGIVAENLRDNENQNKALLDYYKRMMIMRGYNIGTVKNETDPEIEEAYTDGFSQEPTGANALNAMTGYDMARQEVARALGLAEGDDVDVFLNGRTAEDIAKGDTDVENAVKNYQQQKARMEGIQEKFQQTREQQYEESDRSIQANDNNGMVYATQLKDEPVFITGGNVVLNEDGTIDVDNSSETLYVKFPDGHVEMTSPDKFTEVFTEDRTEDPKAAKRAEIDAKWKAEFDTAEAQSVEQEKREAGVVFDKADAQGNHRIEILNEGEEMSDILLDGAQMEIPTEELNRWKQEAGIQSAENGVQSVDAVVDNATDNGTPTESEANVAPTGDNVAPVAPVELPNIPDFFRLGGKNYSVASRNDDGSVDVMVDGKRETLPAGTDYSTLMPTDKKGDIAFADMPVERTHEYFVQRVTNDKKRAEMIDNNRKKAEAERKKFDKEPDAGLDPDKWEEVNRKWEEGKKAAQAKVDYWKEVGKREAEITRSETREAVENIKPDVMEETADEFIANQLAGIKITPESFAKETGLSKAEQKKLVGVISKNGVSVERAAEIILENYESELAGLGFTGDVQDVRDAIISILSQGNPRGYAKRGYEAREAENMDQQRADAEAWAKGAFDMTLDELYLYEKTVLPRIVREYEGFDENEYYSNLAENNGYDTTRESESIGRGGELLQGEQSVPAGGTPVVGQRNEGGTVSDDVQGGSQNGVAQEEVPVSEPVGNSEQLSSSEIPNNQYVAEGDAPGNGGVYADNQGNPVDADGKLIVDEVNSIDEITDEDFETPTRNVQLPAIPENVANAIGTNGRPVVIKRNVFEKNGNTHVELEPEDSRNILRSALYNPNLVGSTQPIRRPDYKVAIRTGEQNAVVILDVYQEKDFVEIVGWRMVNEKGLAKMQRQAEREGGQFLILSPNDGSAAALSALPLGLSSAGEGTTQSANKQENRQENAGNSTLEQIKAELKDLRKKIAVNGNKLRRMLHMSKYEQLTADLRDMNSLLTTVTAEQAKEEYGIDINKWDEVKYDALWVERDQLKQQIKAAEERLKNAESAADDVQSGVQEITNDERVEMEARIVDWLSEDNLERASGKTRDEIFDEFGNELEPIAYIPTQYISLVNQDLKDQRIYCGKGYFIDHALRNHAKGGKQLNAEDVDVSKYLNIQSVLDNPDSVKETYVDGKRTVVFIKKIGRYFAELTQVEEDGKIVLHKSMFDQKKEPYAKLDDIRSKGTSSEGGVSSISHTAEAAPAISLESRGDVVSNSTESSVSEDRNSVSNSQENTQKSGEIAENGGEKKSSIIEEAEAEYRNNPLHGVQFSMDADAYNNEDVTFGESEQSTEGGALVSYQDVIYKGQTIGWVKETQSGRMFAPMVTSFYVPLENATEEDKRSPHYFEGEEDYMRFATLQQMVDYINSKPQQGEIQETAFLETPLDNGDKKITGMNSRGEVATVTIERDGKVVSVDSYDEGVLFEHTEYDGNGKATSVTRYDKSGNVVGTQVYEDGKAKTPMQKLADRILDRTEEKRRIPLRERARELEAQVGVKANIIESLDEVKNREARRRIVAGQNVAGWYSKGEVYLYMPNLQDRREIELTYVHEVVAHHGVKKLLGERFNEFLDGVWNMMSEADRARMLTYVGANENPTLQDMRAAADEYVAELAEKMNLGELEQSTWNKIVGWFKELLENIGFENLTKEDIESMLKASYSNLRAESRKGKTGSTENDFRARMTFHGSGAQFDRFDHSFMGTGEGAQAFGWGTTGGRADGARNYVIFNENDAQIENRTQFRIKDDAQNRKDSERRKEKVRINNIIDTAAGIIYGNKEYAKKQRLKREAERKQLAKEMYSAVLKGDFNDVTLSQIDKFIEDATPLNPFGRRISQRLPQRMERALRQGARTNAVDALFSRISESAVPANERFSEAGRREIEERKKELLKGWAIATGNWHTDLKEFTDDTEPIGEGKDSKVYSSKDGRYVIKASKGKPYGKRFRPDIDNIALFNDVFRDTRYEILGYGEIDGEFVRILQQPIVDFAQSTPLTSEERREYMQSLGFYPLNDANTAFADGEIVIADLQKGNVVRDAAGNISVIDADAKLHTKDVGGDYTYPPVEEDLPEDSGTRFRIANENQDIFVSNAQRAVEGIQQNKATPEQWQTMLQKNGGLKAGEDKWLGLSEWLAERGKMKGENGKVEPVTKQEVLEFIAENAIRIEEVEYSENARFKGQSYYADRYNAGEADDVMPANDTRLGYTTEGLENKREIALVVPTIESWNASDEIHFGDAGNGRAVAWVRFGETTDSEGNRVLVIDEIQSKRHQDGREKGYKATDAKEKLDTAVNAYRSATQEHDTYRAQLKEKYDYGSFAGSLYDKGVQFLNSLTQEERAKLDELISKQRKAAEALDKAREAQRAIPDAPFDKNWHELAMKRMLRLAAEEGFDKVAWTTGEQQAERYNLGRRIELIQSEDNNTELFNDGTAVAKDVRIVTSTGGNINFKVGEDGIIRGGEFAGRSVAEVFGKDLGARIMSPGRNTIEEDGLRIGGEGMKGFYDRMLPSFVQKYTKKWGASVGTVEMPGLDENNVMHSVDVTPEMQESVMQGQTMFRIKRTAPETESVQEEHQPSVVSSADGAKVLKNIDDTIEEYDKNANKRSNTFLGDVAKAIGAVRKGSGSQYVTLEAANGNIVTIRLSNHNATVSNFDNNGEDNGISIVVTAKQNNGITNDGNAHITEFFYDAIKLRKADGKPLVEILKSIKQALYSGEYKDNTGLAEVQEVNDDIRFRIKDWSNNRGYTQREDGSRISVRAADAEADGAFTAGTFRKVYGVSKADFDALVEIGAIVKSEWHHTGANFKESDFYSWRDRGDMDYTDGVPEEGSWGDIYRKNKKEIFRLVKEYQLQNWEYEDKRSERYVPSLKEFATGVVKLNAREQADAKREHAEISSRGEALGPSYYRRFLHEEVDAKYKEIARERFERENPGELERLYEDEYGESIAFNRDLAERNNAAEEHNRQTTGKEATLLKIADILGVDAKGKVEGVSRVAREKERREQRKADAESIKQSFETEMERKRKALDKWIADQRKKGGIKDVVRIPEKDAPEFFVTEKEEMNGRYGWFEASRWRYNMPVYVSGMEFAGKRLYDSYRKRVKEIRDAQEKFDFEYSKVLYDENYDGRGLRALVGEPEDVLFRVADHDGVSENNANFASRYETKDGKTVNYTSERGEAYGVQDAGTGNLNSGTGRSILQRQTDTGAPGANSDLDIGNGEFCVVERVFVENGAFNFTGNERIESADDVAYIFSALEDAAKEHSFVVYVKDGIPTVVELGMGKFNATMFDIPTASLAYSRIQPDHVYFVHNHPSGNLMCSNEDIAALARFEEMSDVPVTGVIINLKTGKYGTFETNRNFAIGTKRSSEKENRLTVYSLDKQIFAHDYDPMAQPLVRGSQDVAQFLNSHRMGDRAKVSFLIISQAGRIIGNIHTPFTEISTNTEEVARYISERVIQFGGKSAILYGDFSISLDERGDFTRLQRALNDVGESSLLDVVRVEGNFTKSAADLGLIYEPQSEYDPKQMVREIVQPYAKELREERERAERDNGTRFRFIGERGAANLDRAEEATTRLDNLAVARVMETGGKDAKSIKLATGWERGADGKWRYETPDELDFDFDATEGAAGSGTQEGEARFRTVEDVIEQQQENEVSLAREAVTSLGEKLNTPVKIMDNLDSVPENRRKWKGWFDPKAGEVVVVMPNHVSTEDAVQTVLHEVVGHKGLRAVLGEDFDGFLDGVYKNASPKVKRGINDKFLNALRNGPALTVREATEEYIAELAERDFEGHKDTWNAIRQWFRNFFRNFMNMEITDGELRYLLWKNYNRMKSGPVEAILDRAMEANTGTGKVMARTAETYSAVDVYNKSVKGFKNKFKEGWYDEMRSLKKAQEAIEKELGREIMDSENVYLYANHIPSINKNKKEVFDNKYLRPFTSLLKQLYGKEVNGKELDEKAIERYTNAKHGIERNREMSVKNALTEVQDGKKVFNEKAYKSWAQERDEVRKKNLPWAEEQRELDRVARKYGAKIRDYSGLTAIFDTDKKLRYKKIADAAYQYVADVEKALGDDVNKLWGLLKGMTDYSLNEAFESGMMSKSTYEHIKQMYRYYVPLRGFTEETAEDFFDYVEGDHSPLNAVVKTAYGRKSEADNIFATILNMANSAIVQGSKNRLKQRLLNLAMRSQTGLLNVDNAWYEKKGDTYEPVNYPDKADEYADFEERMKDKEKRGEVVRHRPGLDIGWKVAETWNKTQHAVRVKRNGREYVVWVNGDPTMANAINGLLREEFGGVIKTVNQFRSKMVTQYSPTFVFTNLLRDVQSASIIYAVLRGTTMLKEFEKNVASNATEMMDLYLKYKRGTLDVNNPKERYFKEFLENGGETGYTEMISIEEYEKKLKELTTGLNIKNGTQRASEAVGGAVDFANRCVENLCRFSAYQTSREAGISVLKSIEDAKEVSVNFNRKGSGAMGQKYAKAGFMFLNPAVQSIAQRILLTKKYPKKMAAVWAGEFILGAAMPVLYSIISAALGDDDDEITGNYYNLSDYRRRSSLCLPLKDGVFHIPLSHESRVLFGFGELCTSVVMGHEKPEDAPIEALNTLAQSLPLNPVEGWMPGKNIIETAVYNFMPDAAKPVAEAVMNRDFAGSTIHNRTDFNEFMPEYMRGKRGTLGAYKKISKYLTSTDGYEKSFLNNLLGGALNPSVMEHLLEGYLGGLYTFVEKVAKAGAWAFGNEEYAEFRNIPIASSFYTSLAKYEDKPTESRTRRDWENAFRFYKDEVKNYDDKEKTAKNGLKHGEEGADLVLEQMERNGEVLMVDIFNDGNDRLKELYGASDAARKNRDFKRVEDIDQQIYAEKRNIVSQMEQLADDPMIGYTFKRNKIEGPYGERETYGDVRDEKIIDDILKEVKPYMDGHNGTEAYGRSFKRHLDLYKNLGDVEDYISDLKRYMKNYPGKADECMNNIREKRAEAIKQINNYRKDE